MNTHFAAYFALLTILIGLQKDTASAQKLPVASADQRIVLDTKGSNQIEFSQPGSPNIVLAETIEGKAVDLSFNKDATEVSLTVPESNATQTIQTLTTENSQQFSDGTMVFSALDCRVHGKKAKLESHPGSHRIGFWVEKDDHVTWSFKPQRWGRYSVELLYSQAGVSGNQVYASFESATDKAPLKQSLTTTLDSTGSWYTYRVASLGELYIDDQTFRHTIELKVGCTTKVANAVMNLKAVLLRPTFEGKQTVEATEDSKVTLLAKDASVHGVQLVYEPNPKKNTIGWWVVPTDKVRWQFETKESHDYSVEVLQGCGEGQGGSKIAVEVLKLSAPTFEPRENEPNDWLVTSFEFEVEDTGDFQNYKRRTVGNLKLDPGTYLLQVRPISIAKNAAMDLRQVVLTPATAE